MIARTILASLMLLPTAIQGFAIVAKDQRSVTALQMGLFDGVKEAFSAPTLQRTTIDAERESPIDRWMGWSVASENKNDSTAATRGT